MADATFALRDVVTAERSDDTMSRKLDRTVAVDVVVEVSSVVSAVVVTIVVGALFLDRRPAYTLFRE